MRRETVHSLLFGPSLRCSYWTLLTLTILSVAAGWFLILATNVPRVPGGEAIGGPVLVAELTFGLLLTGLSIVGCTRLTWSQVFLGVVGGGSSTR
jgi:hypothetical protein